MNVLLPGFPQNIHLRGKRQITSNIPLGVTSFAFRPSMAHFVLFFYMNPLVQYHLIYMPSPMLLLLSIMLSPPTSQSLSLPTESSNPALPLAARMALGKLLYVSMSPSLKRIYKLYLTHKVVLRIQQINTCKALNSI